MGVTSIFAIPLRIAQMVLAIIIMGLTAYGVDVWASPYWFRSPSSIYFLLFTSVWTIFALIYLVLASALFGHHFLGHKFGVLIIEVITTIFWFSGFIAVAVLVDGLPRPNWSVKRATQAAAVFGAFEWLLFSATLVLSALHCWRSRGEFSSKPDPNMQVDGRV